MINNEDVSRPCKLARRNGAPQPIRAKRSARWSRQLGNWFNVKGNSYAAGPCADVAAPGQKYAEHANSDFLCAACRQSRNHCARIGSALQRLQVVARMSEATSGVLPSPKINPHVATLMRATT